MITTFEMDTKFLQFLGNTYRILLEEFCIIDKIEITESAAYFECKSKKKTVELQNKR